MAFFDLEPGFETLDLKRAYNRWIRRFKPERAPEEFQRIRAAYEHLDEVLRYGQQGEAQYSGPGTTETLQELTELVEAADYPTLQRLDQIAPSEVLRELRSFEPKSPKNWIHLALLADEINRDDPLILQRTLIQGVQATRGDDELVRFLMEACHQPLSTAEVGKLVAMLHGLVSKSEGEVGFHPSWYFYATEHLWLILIRKAKFPSFRKLFERICGDVPQAGYGAYLVMVLRLVRRGAFRAEPQWLEERFKEVTASYHQLPHWLQGEVDTVDWLDAYRSTRTKFLAEHNGRKVADRALRLIISGDEVEADRAFLEAQFYALDHREEFLEAYPARLSIDPVSSVFFWYSELVEERGGGGGAQNSSPRKRRDMQDFLYSVERTTDKSWRGRVWQFMNLFKLWLLSVFCFLPLVLLLSDFMMEVSPMVYWPLMVAYVTLLVVSWTKSWFSAFLKIGNAPIAEWIYDEKWRSDCLDFLESTHMPWDEFLEGIRTFNDNKVISDGHIYNSLVQDPGLALYALALGFAK